MYRNNNVWRELQALLPEKNRIDHRSEPEKAIEEFLGSERIFQT